MRSRRVAVARELDDETRRRLGEAPTFSPALRAGADKLISENPHYQRVVDEAITHPGDLEKVAERVRIATKKSHVEALALAYAFWIQASFNASYSDFILAAARKRKRIRSDTTRLHLIVDQFVTYGDDDQSATGSKRGLYSRDVRIILWMQQQGISPDQLRELGDQPGEGLVIWDKRQRKPKNKIKCLTDAKLSLVHSHQLQLDRRARGFQISGQIDLLLSFQAASEDGKHFYLHVPDTDQTRLIIEEFKDRLRAERDRVRVGQARSYNAVTRGEPLTVENEVPS